MGMRMTEGISHKVSYSLEVKVVLGSQREESRSFCVLFSAALGAL